MAPPRSRISGNVVFSFVFCIVLIVLTLNTFADATTSPESREVESTQQYVIDMLMRYHEPLEYFYQSYVSTWVDLPQRIFGIGKNTGDDEEYDCSDDAEAIRKTTEKNRPRLSEEDEINFIANKLRRQLYCQKLRNRSSPLWQRDGEAEMNAKRSAIKKRTTSTSSPSSKMASPKSYQEGSIISEDSEALATFKLSSQPQGFDPSAGCASGFLVRYMTDNDDYLMCLCPLDWYGANCESQREFQCTPTLVSPKKDCIIEPSTFPIDSDPSCLRFTSDQSIQFQYNLTCSFTGPRNPFEDDLDPDARYQIQNNPQYTGTYTLEQVRSFMKYYARDGDRFAVSREIPTPFEFKVYNFWSLSDDRFALAAVLQPEQWLGQQLITFDLNLPDIKDDEFYAGNRLYAEAGFRYTSSNAYLKSLTMHFDRVFVDVTDRPEPKKVGSVSTTQRTLYIVIPVVIGVVVAAALAIYYVVNKVKDYRMSKEQ